MTMQFSLVQLHCTDCTKHRCKKTFKNILKPLKNVKNVTKIKKS